VPLITVVTDLTGVHHQWFNDVSDLCLVPTRTTHHLAVQCGLPPHKVKITGIPVHPRICEEQRAPAVIRADLGWQPDLPTVLVAGSKRVPRLASVLRAINDSSVVQQLAVVAGGDDALYRQLQEVEWRPVTHLYNFVANMPTLMRAADCIICKAGGLIVSEALACGLPILLVDVIEGQETGNANYVISGDAGELAHSPGEALDILRRWFNQGGELLAKHAQNARALAHPHAAFEIAEMVWSASERRPHYTPTYSMAG
jgi:UDP-N-acetylglucosamine:LPS N-acetylglucosamine transferase